jgi:hypothetical protein
LSDAQHFRFSNPHLRQNERTTTNDLYNQKIGESTLVPILNNLEYNYNILINNKNMDELDPNMPKPPQVEIATEQTFEIPPEPKGSGSKIAILVIVFLLIAGAAGAGYWFFVLKKPATSEQPKQDQQQEQVNCDLAPNDLYIIVSGKVMFPKGIQQPTDYKVSGYNGEKNNIASNGEFCAYGRKGVDGIITVANPTKADAFTLVAVVSSDVDVKNIVIDAKSTAMGIVYFQSFAVLTTSRAPTEDLLAKIEQNPQVATLAEQITNAEELSLNDLKSGPIADAAQQATTSVISDITTSAVCDPACFAQKFTLCEAAATDFVASGELVYHDEIIGLDPETGLCNVRVSFGKNPNPDLLNKDMVCKYNQTLAFSDAVKDSSKCLGTLYDALNALK